MTSKRKVVQGLLALASLGFLLPFVTVSCQGMKVVSLSGTQLLTGTKISGGDMFQATAVPPNTALIIGFVCGVLAIGFGFKSSEKLFAWLATIASSVSTLTLLGFMLTAPDQVRKFTMQAFSLDMELGFWLSFGAYFLSSAISVKDAIEAAPAVRSSQPVVSSPPGSSTPAASPTTSSAAPATPVRFCPSCGSERVPGKAFCPSCGAALDAAASQPAAPAAPPVVREPRKPLTSTQKWTLASGVLGIVVASVFYQIYTSSKAKPVTIVIHSNMNGGNLYVDGVDYSLASRFGPGGPAGMPNWQFTTTRQTHSIRITHESATPWEGTVDPGIFEKQHVVEAKLVQQTYVVNFVTNPGGTRIITNQGNDLTTGSNGTMSTSLMSGSYTATASHPGYPSMTTSFFVSPGNVNTVQFDLEAERGRQQSEQAANVANLIAQANQLFQQQRYDEALAMCDSALQADPANAQALEMKKNIKQTQSILGGH